MSLYAALYGLKMGEAARRLAGELGPQAQAKPNQQPAGRIVAVYDYLEADGQVVFQVVRKEPKDFRQRKPDGRGGWEWTIKGVELVPYRLPEVVQAQAVFIAEGEKDCDGLAALGLIATTCAQGAGKWRPEYNHWFQGKRVCILPDNDDPGRKHALAVARQLHGVASAIKVVELPNLPPKGDVSDWLKAGGTREALMELVKAAPEWRPQDSPDGEQVPPGVESSRAFRFLPLADILAAPRPTRWLIRGYLEAETLAVLFGEAGSMKSFLAIDLSLCIATGTPWHGHAIPNPGATFYLAGEGFHGLAKRIKAWTTAYCAAADIPFFVSSTPAQLLDTAHVREVADAVAALAEQHGPPRLVVIDTLARSFVGGDENSSQDMGTFVGSLDALKARFGCAVLVVHHSGLQEKGRSRGSSVLRAAADFEYRLAAKGDVRVLSCSKVKDFELPADMAFEPETVELPGWTDFETMEAMTSCILRRTEMPQSIEQGPALAGAKKIAWEALLAACERAGGSCHVSIWREEAYSRGISTSGPEARKKAFKRATEDLGALGLIKCEREELWIPAR